MGKLQTVPKGSKRFGRQQNLLLKPVSNPLRSTPVPKHSISKIPRHGHVLTTRILTFAWQILNTLSVSVPRCFQVSMPSSTAPGELQQRGDLNGEQFRKFGFKLVDKSKEWRLSEMELDVCFQCWCLYSSFLLSLSPGLYKLERRLAFFNNAQLQTQTKALICRTLTRNQKRIWTHRESLRDIPGSEKRVPFGGVFAGAGRANGPRWGFFRRLMVDAGLLETTTGSGRFPDVRRFTAGVHWQRDGWCRSLGIAHVVLYFGANVACRGQYRVKETRMVSLLAGC